MAAFNGNIKVFKPTPPEKGSFPLDHLGECTKLKETYMQCLKENSGKNSACRVASRDYLVCRMDNELMAKESMARLGYADLEATKSIRPNESKS